MSDESLFLVRVAYVTVLKEYDSSKLLRLLHRSNLEQIRLSSYPTVTHEALRLSPPWRLPRIRPLFTKQSQAKTV